MTAPSIEERLMRLRYIALSLAPATIPLVWLIAGQWLTATANQRAWLQLMTMLLAAALVPVDRPAWKPDHLLQLVRVWGWVVVAGLMLLAGGR
jgi:hypothetical protein